MYTMYAPAEFAPLSPASMKKLLKGQTVRVKHGSGLKIHLSKAQYKKHQSSKLKGKGYNLTLDPYQSQMHGQGFFEDVGSAFKQLGNSFVENVAKPVGREIVNEGKKQGRKVASQLIHEGIPFATSTLGGIAGSTLGGLSTNPLAVPAGEMIGQELGQYGGTKLADYIGRQTGYGFKDVMNSPAMKKAMKPRLLGGTALIDQPFTTRQAVDTTGRFFKDPAKTFGFGVKPPARKHAKRHAKKVLVGGTALIDQPFTVRQAVDTTGRFFKDPKGTFGFGMDGGTALIDQPFTARQAVDTTGRFFKNPAGTLGFGLRRGRRGGALIQAGY